MASSLALKRLLSSSNLLNRTLRPARPLTQPASARVFNTNAAREFDEDEDEGSLGFDRRSGRSLSGHRGYVPFADVFDPLSRRSVSQLLSMMDQFMESPVTTGFRQAWDVKETNDALYLRVDMPGLGKEDVKVSVEQNTLIIEGEGKKEFEDDEQQNGRKVSSRIGLPEKVYKTDGIKAEMKNGVLKVVVPKIKEEERAGVVHVKVE